MRGGLSNSASAASWSVAALLFAILGCSENTDLADTTPPAAVADLAAVDPTPNSVTLRWTAPADKGTTGNAAAAHIAAWNGSSWSPLGSGTNDAVYALAIYDNKLIAAGKFTAAGGAAASFIAAWNGISWSALGSGTSGGYYPYTMALAPYSDRLAAGGNFTMAGGVEANRVAAWDASSWAPLGSGTNDNVSALLSWNGQLIVGGWFSNAGAALANCIAAWDGTNWSPLGSGLSSPSSPAIVYALTVYNGRLVAGGVFTAAGGVPASNIAVWGD